MAEQTSGTSPSRNASTNGGTLQSTVSVGVEHKSTVTSDVGTAPVKPGSSVQGFSGSGVLPGFAK